MEDQKITVVTSELTLLEVLVKPLRDGDDFLIALYRKVLLETKGLQCVGIALGVLLLAAQIRSDWRLMTPDAIHAATAIQAGAPLFVTNDRSFLKVPGLNVVILDDVISC